MTQLYKDLKIENEAPSKLTVTAKVTAEQLPKMVEEQLKDRAKNMVLPGFRKGEAPMELVQKHINKEILKQDAAKDLVAQALAQIIIENQLKVIGQPNIELQEIKDGEDLSFTAQLVVLPEIQIDSKYKDAISKLNKDAGVTEVTVSDEDVANVLLHLRREKARILTLEAMQKDKNVKMPDFASIPEDKLPQLDEKDFKDLTGTDTEADFKSKVKENIRAEKEIAEKEKRRGAIAEELIKHCKVDLPDEIVEMELERANAQMQQDLQMMGMTLDIYLSQIQKSKEDFEKEMREAARRRAILQLALDKIAQEEDIRPSPEEVQKETEHALSHNPNANKDEMMAYVDAQLSNEKVFNFLENL